MSLLFSCEHATCAVPEAHRELFRGSEDIVTSPEGWDPGALNLAQGFSIKFRTPLVHGDLTRLLIDLDENGDRRWSRFSEKLSDAVRGKLVDRHERVYRALLHQRIAEDLSRHPSLVHLLIHTAPEPAGQISLATAPDAALAETFASAWTQRLRAAGLDIRHRRAAALSGLAGELLEAYPPDRYAAIRLEVSQSFFLEGRPWRWETLKKTLIATFKETADDPALTPSPASPSSD